MPVNLTKADTVALWHAVQAMRECVRAMRTLGTFTPEQVAAEQARLKAALAALRKVNRVRRRQGGGSNP